jgi:hypothetical protein
MKNRPFSFTDEQIDQSKLFAPKNQRNPHANDRRVQSDIIEMAAAFCVGVMRSLVRTACRELSTIAGIDGARFVSSLGH